MLAAFFHRWLKNKKPGVYLHHCVLLLASFCAWVLRGTPQGSAAVLYVYVYVCVCEATTVGQPHVTVTGLPNFFRCHKPPSLSPAPTHSLTQKQACPDSGISQKRSNTIFPL